MKIKLYWPNCTLHFKEFSFNDKDAFFLECSFTEAKEQLFSLLTDEQINQCIRDYDPNPLIEQLEFGIETNSVCFLISRDQKSLIPEPWYFPYSGQWNAYNPFVKIKEIEIVNIEQLADINVVIEN